VVIRKMIAPNALGNKIQEELTSYIIIKIEKMRPMNWKIGKTIRINY